MRNAKAIKDLVVGLLQLHHRYLPGETDALLRKLESADVGDPNNPHYGTTYSLFTQSTDKEYMGEDTFYTGLRAGVPLKTQSFAGIHVAIETMFKTITTDGEPYAYYVLGVGDMAADQTNHFVSLFAFKKNLEDGNDQYVIRFFNPLPNEHYNQFLNATSKAISDYKSKSNLPIVFENHATQPLQDNETYCAEYSSLYLYLCTLEYNVKYRNYDINNKNEHDLFFESLNPPYSCSDIIEQLKETSAYTVFSNLVLHTRQPNQYRIETKIREMNLDYWAQRVTREELIDAVDKIIKHIRDYYDSSERTQAERIIIALSLAAILAGFYIQTASISITGAGIVCFILIYDHKIDNDLRDQGGEFKRAIDNAFLYTLKENTLLKPTHC